MPANPEPMYNLLKLRADILHHPNGVKAGPRAARHEAPLDGRHPGIAKGAAGPFNIISERGHAYLQRGSARPGQLPQAGRSCLPAEASDGSGAVARPADPAGSGTFGSRSGTWRLGEVRGA